MLKAKEFRRRGWRGGAVIEDGDSRCKKTDAASQLEEDGSSGRSLRVVSSGGDCSRGE